VALGKVATRAGRHPSADELVLLAPASQCRENELGLGLADVADCVGRRRARIVARVGAQRAEKLDGELQPLGEVERDPFFETRAQFLDSLTGREGGAAVGA
jgi:hypothetical protein